MALHIAVDRTDLAAYCREHHIRRLAFFGSVLREDFGDESDVDVLVEFEPGARVSYFTLGGIQQDLSELFGRPVDVKTPTTLSRYIQQRVLDSAQTVYAHR